MRANGTGKAFPVGYGALGGIGAGELTQPRIYTGNGLSQKGDKGRFILPPDLRKQVRDASEGLNKLCLARHHKWNCLIGFGTSRTLEFHAILERERQDAKDMGDTEWDYDTRSQQLFGFETVPFDESGRFLIPDYLTGLGAIGERIYFQGGGGFIMLWAPEELDKMGDAFVQAKATCAALIASAKTGGRGRK